MGHEKDADFYNSVYQSSEKYKKKPELIEYYYEVWCEGINLIKNHVSQPKNIIDLGCGPGHFASLLASNLDTLDKYEGYDFSDTAINMAQSLVCQDDRFNFYEQNLREFNFPKEKNLVVTMYEFLEHISFDLELISKIPPGTWTVFSVPSYDSAGHVRWFDSLQEVKNRYERLIKIESVYTCKVKKNKIYLCMGRKVGFDRPEKLIQVGNKYKREKKLEVAIQIYYQNLEFNSKSYLSYQVLAEALAENGQLLESLAYFHQAITLNQKSAICHFLIGKTLFNYNLHYEATIYFEKALTIHPGLSLASNYLEKAMLKLGKIES
jgi:tetratricopeptide (TPR) repeat protein